MVRRLVHVPRERAPKHAKRSRQYITYPPPHSAHFVRPENRYFGRRVWLNRFGSPFDATRRISTCRAFTWFHRSASTIRSSGTAVVTQSDGGFGRETRFPVSGSLTYRRRFHTSRPTYSSLFRSPVPRAGLPCIVLGFQGAQPGPGQHSVFNRFATALGDRPSA